MTHDTELCAALGHYIGQVAVIYCPHHQAWTMVHSAGDDSDDMKLDSGTLTFGPFDGTDDVARHAASVVSMLVRVRSRQWLHQRQQEDEFPDAGGADPGF